MQNQVRRQFRHSFYEAAPRQPARACRATKHRPSPVVGLRKSLRCPGSPPDAFACLRSKALHQLDAIAERVGNIAAAITGERLAFLEADTLFPERRHQRF